jgi:hypothetical protein
MFLYIFWIQVLLKFIWKHNPQIAKAMLSKKSNTWLQTTL